MPDGQKGLRTTLAAISPLPLRLALGATFIYHGYTKVFQGGTETLLGSLARQDLGIVSPQLIEPLVAYVGFIGGILLVLGFLTRLAALGHGVIMFAAIAKIHFAQGFAMTCAGEPASLAGYEWQLLILAGSLALVLGGAGPISIDGAVVGKKKKK